MLHGEFHCVVELLFDDCIFMLLRSVFRSWAFHDFHFSTLLELPDLFSFIQSAGKPFLRLPATTFVESIGLRYRERAAAHTDITPSWRHAVMRLVMGRTWAKTILDFDEPLCSFRWLGMSHFTMNWHSDIVNLVARCEISLHEETLMLIQTAAMSELTLFIPCELRELAYF